MPQIITDIFKAIDGNKTHIFAALGILLVTFSHFSGARIPGVNFDDANWLQTDYTLLGVMCGRDALRKIQDALGGINIETLLNAAALLKAGNSQDTRQQTPGA